MPNTPSSVATRRQSVFPPRAQTYVKQATSGQTVLLPRDFKGFGALLAYSVPLGVEVTAVMLPPAGPRALNNPFRASLEYDDTGGAKDVVITET